MTKLTKREKERIKQERNLAKKEQRQTRRKAHEDFTTGKKAVTGIGTIIIVIVCMCLITMLFRPNAYIQTENILDALTKIQLGNIVQDVLSWNFPQWLSLIVRPVQFVIITALSVVEVGGNIISFLLGIGL